ncbi:MAG TPA: GTP cyclohydrolase I FolE [Cyclobacteriaceae bacterium]|nr:GTP cyclohydrolase I FolE [Cyclobacteriaceae bacterium]
MTNTANRTFQISHQVHELSLDTDVSNLSESDKINTIAFHFRKIMEVLGLDLEDDSLRDTPSRVAKMYVREIFSGLEPNNFPGISVFDNTYGYKEMLIERDIQVYSYCEHHFVPIVGKAHVAYFPSNKVIGLSKLNRVVKYFSRRPQVQERLTMDIANAMKEILQTEDIAVVIEAKHFCVAARGIEDPKSTTVTTHFGGQFALQENKSAFYAHLKG